MRSYSCYDLTLDSAIELPELNLELRPGRVADIVIELGHVGPPTVEAVDVGDGLWRDPHSCWVAIEGVGRFKASEGSRIVVDLEAHADDRDIRLFLLGTVLGSIMMQRGNLVLHGSAVRIADACAVIVGHSGAGKSTLSAEFARRGIDVLSDDVVPIDAAGRGLPGYPHIKLWDDALARLGRSADGLARVRPAAPKFSVPINRGDPGTPVVKWVYALEIHDSPDLEFVTASGIDKFALLSEHTYRGQLICGQDSVWRHAQQCAALGGRVRAARVRRSRDSMTPEATADAILADIAAH